MVRVKFLRLERGIKQYKVADALGIHVADLSEIENFIRRPTAKQLADLAAFYNVPAERLLEFVSDEAMEPQGR